MSDERGHDEQEALAQEYALQLLSGEELRVAAGRISSDPAFAQDVARWRGRLAPMLDEIGPSEPPSALWMRIDRATGDGASNVVILRRRVSRWRAAAAGMTAVAASLGAALYLQPKAVPVPPPFERPAAAAPLVAMLAPDGKASKVVVSWDPSARQLVLAVPGELPADAAHSHELWVIPTNGKPHSLGTLSDGTKMHMRLADALAQLLQRGATIAISVEPKGGSPTGQPTGPVVVSGALDQA